jgi:hypothetical protein
MNFEQKLYATVSGFLVLSAITFSIGKANMDAERNAFTAKAEAARIEAAAIEAKKTPEQKQLDKLAQAEADRRDRVWVAEQAADNRAAERLSNLV